VQTITVKVTFYGYPDNDDGNHHFGTNIIANAFQWRGQDRNRQEIAGKLQAVAGGCGTYDDPITVAVKADNAVIRQETLFYIPGLKKYFFVEDECASCETDAWIDIWMESNAQSPRVAMGTCEDLWTGEEHLLHEIIIDPPADLDVDLTPFFDTTTNRCTPPTW
jgi:3D (Asp-Asp-Asp) domain-containing protein